MTDRALKPVGVCPACGQAQPGLTAARRFQNRVMIDIHPHRLWWLHMCIGSNNLGPPLLADRRGAMAAYLRDMRISYGM